MHAMKLRHAAALALAGWYLMMPTPPSKDSGYWGKLRALAFGSPQYAPMSQWQQLGTFDTAKECEAGKTTARAIANSIIKGDDPVCIATDDPRLKGN